MPADLTLLFAMSAPRRVAGARSELNHSASSNVQPPSPSVAAAVPRQPDPRRHSAVCCCLLCELHDTGEQAMRAVGGDYDRFLARVASHPAGSDRLGGHSAPSGSSVTTKPVLRTRKQDA